jgi:uncharacterized Fe-S cluster-containing MiaB family protein
MITLTYLLIKFCFSIAAPPALQDWTRMAETFDNLTESVSIIMIRCNGFL